MSKRKSNQKRRDKKGRILRTGESQRKDGRYVYVYTDAFGKQKFLYSWKLEQTDPLPAGCRPCQALRMKEQELQKDFLDGIIPYGGNLTVLELLKRYVAQRTGVKDNTKESYEFMIALMEKEVFGTLRIDKIKPSDAKMWFIKLQEKKNYQYGTMCTIRGIIRPAFQMAVGDELIRKNPFDFNIRTVIIGERGTRQSLSTVEEEKFLEFVRTDGCYKKYYNGIFILFKTGLRISELCGLTVQDIDFERRIINVDHQLIRKNDMSYYIETPKSKHGIRKLPMSDEVYECMRKIVEKRKKRKKEPVIDGYSKFLFSNRNGMPDCSTHWDKRFARIMRKYNKLFEEEKMQKVTPHVCRHTYCTNMARSGINPKILQYLMGHATIQMTLNFYTHLGLDDVKEEIKRIEKLI